ncbi:hypothetical protein PL8927_730033 [Planktothrix serta PCC 8927]|uniref:Uncharacterized protein n=1 Tax=Planktothrix serta PCC 8927 TaxID=671068 RepID=A0A7Z9BTB7_9CYAN|nr:hypothetical protein PL8927_730033 [Planktothrix serta PCC 8927]
MASLQGFPVGDAQSFFVSIEMEFALLPAMSFFRLGYTRLFIPFRIN